MFSYSDPSLGIIWIDTNGLHDAASLAAFLAAADFATVTKIVLPDSETLGHRPITSVTGLDSFPLLNWLILGGCSLTTIDVSQNPQLTQLELDLNFLTALDVTQNPLLIYLSFTQNGLTSVDLSNNRLLINLYAEQNSLFSASVDDILCKLDSYGLTNADAQSILGPQARAFVTLQGNSLPSMVGQACAERLVSKGWQVTTNLGDNQAPLWPPTTLPPLSNTGSGPGSGQPKLSTNGVLSNPRICGVGILVTDCPGSDSPILNFSSESPDRLFFFGTGYTPFNAWSPPRLGEQYTAPNCLGVEFSVASQEIANLIARLNPVICLGNSSTPTTPGTPVVRRVPFYNTAQAASGGCSSQATFNFVVQPGLFVVMAYPAQYAGAQAQVDAQAQAYAQQQVVHYDFCADCTDPLNLKACVGGVYSSTNLFVLKGSPGNANWTSSGLPPGIHLSPGTTTGVTDASGDSWVRTGANRWTNLTTGASQANAPQGTNSSTTGTADLLGVPTQPGNYNFTVTATASNGNSSTWHGTFSVLGFSNFSLDPAGSVLPNGSICNGYNYQLSAVGGTPPYTFFDANIPGPVPYGLSIINGVMSGALSAGTYHFTLGVKDSLDQECTQLFVLTIDPSATQPSITTAGALPNGHANHPYFTPIVVTGGCPNPYASPPYTMTVFSGLLPFTFQLAYSGGWEIFGFPSTGQAGNYSFTLKAIDWAGQTITKPFTLTIDTDAVVTGSCVNNPAISSSGISPHINTFPHPPNRATANAEKTQAAAIADLISNLQGLGCNCPPIQVSVDPMGPHTTFTNTSGTCTIVMTTGSEYGPITLLPGGVFDLYNNAQFTIGFDASGPYTFGLGGGVSIVITY
jgi:hypothetical protein